MTALVLRLYYRLLFYVIYGGYVWHKGGLSFLAYTMKRRRISLRATSATSAIMGLRDRLLKVKSARKGKPKISGEEGAYGKVLVLGTTPANDLTRLQPLNYPVSPGSEVRLPSAEAVKTLLAGDEDTHRLYLGSVIGRPDIEIRVKTNAIVARHMAILAMTGGGKTVAARQISQLMSARYPLLILDPHGDYLGLSSLDP